MIVNKHMHYVLYGLIRLLIDDLAVLPKNAQQVRINVSDALPPARVGIPAFIDMGPDRPKT